MAGPVTNLGRAEWKELGYGERFAARVVDLARPMGASKLGYNVQEIPPGKVNVPYHTHYVNEELIVVLDGELRIRLDGVQHDLRARDVVALPPGAASAHQLLNYGDRPARALLASTMIPREYVEYLDSGKRSLGVAGLAREPAREVAMIHEGRVLAPGDPANYFLGEPFDEPLGEAPATSRDPSPRIANLDELPWVSYQIGPFRAERKRVGRHVGARLLGYSLYRVQPGDRTFPYHLEHTNEEFALVLAGRARLRTPEGEREVGPDDAICFPVGPDGAHGFTAIGDEPFEVFFLSTMIEPDVAEYPDSDKVYVIVGAAPGGDPASRALDLVFRKRDAVPYETDEA
jgi:uncharacterized cupin superfamily protein